MNTNMRHILFTFALSFFAIRAGWTAPVDPSTMTVTDFERQALQIHPSLRLATQDAELAKMKSQEAYRAIWPALQLRAEQTRGEAVRELGTPDFTEKSYGIQLNQPVFQGGRLYRVYRQAKANWESAQAKLTKAQQEVIFSVRESSWNFIRARLMVQMLQRALKDLEAERTTADKLIKKDNITRQVYLTVNAQYLQASYALESAQADVEARLWQWTAALGLLTPPDYRPANNIPADILTVSLDQCLAMARQKNPELLIQRKAAESAHQGDLAGKSLNYPKLNFNGFYGRSGAAYDGEGLHMGEDWLMGVQLSQYFGLNTANVSGLAQETSPKIGQSTRTASKTASASIGILDGFKQRNEKKEAEFTNDQAKVQLDRSEMEISNNVREAFAGLKKAQVLMKMAENGVPLAQSEYSIACIRSAHREMPFSERAIARNKLALAEAAWIEAKASYQNARAALNRAVGVPDQF